MLKNFNNLIKSAVFPAILAQEEDAAAKLEWAKSIFDTNLFFKRYIEEPAKKAGVAALKQRENSFLVAGQIDAVKAFFKALKVDSNFIEEPSKFLIYSPCYTFGDVNHSLAPDEVFPEIDYQRFNVPHSRSLENQLRATLDGTWIDFYTGNPADLHKATQVKPSDLPKLIDAAVELVNPEADGSTVIYVEFTVNCAGRANEVWDEMASTVYDPEEILKSNKESFDESEDFDYSALNTKDPQAVKAEDNDWASASVKKVK